MISSELPCPDEAELVALVDADLPPERETDVVTHLAICAECRALLGRTEASLRYALGGIADAAESAPAPVEAAPVAERRRPWLRIAAPLVAAAAVALVAVLIPRDDRLTEPAPVSTLGPTAARTTVQSSETAWATADDALTPDGVDARLDALLSRTRSLRAATNAAAHGDEEDLLAGLLAAREARAAVVSLQGAR